MVNFKNILDSIKSKIKNSQIIDVNTLFTKEEQLAMLQCFWQLLSARPSSSDSELIENMITKDWKCKEECKNVSPFERLALECQLNISDLKPWILCAVQLSPYDAFSTIGNMTYEKKQEFKKLCFIISNNEGNVEYKHRMLISLLEQTNIPF